MNINSDQFRYNDAPLARRNIGLYQDCEQPDWSNDALDRRVITPEHLPVYSKDVLLELSAENAVKPWTSKAIKDAANLGLDSEALAKLLSECLIRGQYRNSEWCEQKPGGPVLVADSYLVTRNEFMTHLNKELVCTYYLKFAIAISGRAVLFPSIHLSGS